VAKKHVVVSVRLKPTDLFLLDEKAQKIRKETPMTADMSRSSLLRHIIRQWIHEKS